MIARKIFTVILVCISFTGCSKIPDISDNEANFLSKKERVSNTAINKDIGTQNNYRGANDSITINGNDNTLDSSVNANWEINIGNFGNEYLETGKAFGNATEVGKFNEACALTSECKNGTNDINLLREKSKSYKSRKFDFWLATDVDPSAPENLLCYEDKILLNNDKNTNPVNYTYHAFVEEKNGKLELQKPFCEKVTKIPRGGTDAFDLTYKDPHNKVCGKKLTKIYCSK